MTNLTDLLPAGAGGKQVSFTASGTISSGQTVALNSDGTVSAVASTGGDPSTGTAVVFEAGALPTSNETGIAFDSSNNKVVISYVDTQNAFYGTAVVGTVSGTSISFGTPVVFESSSTGSTSATFDSSNNKVVIAYNAGGSDHGFLIAGTVSGTSITFGLATGFATATTYNISAVFDTNSNKVVITYRNSGSSDYGTARVATYATPYFTLGSPVVFNTAGTYSPTSVFDSSNNKVVVVYKDANSSFYGTAKVGTVSGSSISFGSATVFSTANSEPYIAFDTTENKVVIIYEVPSPTTFKGIVGTVSGTSISFGSATSIGVIDSSTGSVTYDSSANKIVAFYNADGDSYAGSFVVGTVSGTSISFGTPVSFTGATTYNYASTFDSNANKVVVAYTDTGNSSYGTAAVVSTSPSTDTKFIGIADAAISDTASGNITIKGGVATNSALIPKYASGGSATVFESATVDVQVAIYDSSAQKTIIAYADAGNANYGTVAVGTVSGTSISFGTPVVFNSATSSYIYGAYDANAGKIVLGYQDGGNSNYGTAIVGTVSGTSITFGSATVFNTGSADDGAVIYDSTAQKVAILYKDGANLNSGTGIVGTVSGTSISFGSKTAWKVGATYSIGAAYDSNAGKIVASYRDGTNANYGTAVVGTISGTSISFGSPVVYNNNGTTYGSGITYDSNAQKVVIAYRDGGSSNGGFGVVGTVSGTSISFGTATVFESGITPTDISIAYDSTATSVVIVYRDVDNGSYGTAIVGDVDGTSISFGAKAAYAEVSTLYDTVVYDANANKSVVYYRDTTNSDYGTANVLTISQDLTVGSTYYVQSDGTLSTTSSSVTAGKALSATSINLDYSS